MFVTADRLSYSLAAFGKPTRVNAIMAEDLLEIFEEHPFHPTDPPHGLRNFDLGTLGKDQQRLLNEFKMTQIIENETYLKAHPEVRGLISILLRRVVNVVQGSTRVK